MGDVATWVGAIGTLIGAIGTVSAFVVAFYQINTERRARKLLEKQQTEQQMRDQAEHVSAWVDHETDDGKFALVAILNSSHEPIYQAIVSIERFHYGGPKSAGGDGAHVGNDFRGFVSIVPPGKTFVRVSGQYHGMMFDPAVAIAFVDKANRNWVRKSDGELASIPTNPTDYYNLNRPFHWQLPGTAEKIPLNAEKF